eukprot:symbB.v1.2.031929.t1/scaffold3762.1/size52363/4
MNEKNVLEMCDSPFIVKLYETYDSPENLYLLLEAALGGELGATYMDGKISWGNEACAKFYVAATTLAFQHLHERKIIFRDLKPENLLLTEQGHVKLADFGVAKVLHHGQAVTACGTPGYFAPEVMQCAGYGPAYDWWMLGIVTFQLMSGTLPFGDGEDPWEFFAKVMEGINQVDFPTSCQGDVENLVKGLCNADPTERWPMKEGGVQNVKSATWFTGFDWHAMETMTMQPPYDPSGACQHPPEEVNGNAVEVDPETKEVADTKHQLNGNSCKAPNNGDTVKLEKATLTVTNHQGWKNPRRSRGRLKNCQKKPELGSDEGAALAEQASPDGEDATGTEVKEADAPSVEIEDDRFFLKQSWTAGADRMPQVQPPQQPGASQAPQQPMFPPTQAQAGTQWVDNPTPPPVQDMVYQWVDNPSYGRPAATPPQPYVQAAPTNPYYPGVNTYGVPRPMDPMAGLQPGMDPLRPPVQGLDPIAAQYQAGLAYGASPDASRYGHPQGGMAPSPYAQPLGMEDLSSIRMGGGKGMPGPMDFGQARFLLA